MDLRKIKLIIDPAGIEFKGSYGETLKQTEIESIELVDQLPKITLKINGFALGTIKKGCFKTRNGEIVKLILNADNKPYILITKSDGRKIFFSAKGEPNQKLFGEIIKTLPDIVYKQ